MVYQTVAEVGRYHLAHHRTCHREADTRPHGVAAIHDTGCQLVYLIPEVHLTPDATAGVRLMLSRVTIRPAKVCHQFGINRVYGRHATRSVFQRSLLSLFFKKRRSHAGIGRFLAEQAHRVAVRLTVGVLVQVAIAVEVPVETIGGICSRRPVVTVRTDITVSSTTTAILVAAGISSTSLQT